jgi:hypothetical protein
MKATKNGARRSPCQAAIAAASTRSSSGRSRHSSKDSALTGHAWPGDYLTSRANRATAETQRPAKHKIVRPRTPDS